MLSKQLTYVSLLAPLPLRTPMQITITRRADEEYPFVEVSPNKWTHPTTRKTLILESTCAESLYTASSDSAYKVESTTLQAYPSVTHF